MRNSFFKALSSSLSSFSHTHTLCVCMCVCVSMCDLLLFLIQLQLLLSVYKLHFLGTHTVFTTLHIHKKMALDNSQAILLTAIPRYKHTCTPVHNYVYMCTHTHTHTTSQLLSSSSKSKYTSIGF